MSNLRGIENRTNYQISHLVSLPVSQRLLTVATTEPTYMTIMEYLKLLVECLQSQRTKEIPLNQFLPTIYAGNKLNVLRLARHEVQIDGVYHHRDGLNEATEAFVSKTVSSGKTYQRNRYYAITTAEQIKTNYRGIFNDDILKDYIIQQHHILEIIGKYKNQYDMNVEYFASTMENIQEQMNNFYANHFNWVPQICYDYDKGGFFRPWDMIEFHELDISRPVDKTKQWTNNVFILNEYTHMRFILPYVIDYVKKIFQDIEFHKSMMPFSYSNSIREIMKIIFWIIQLPETDTLKHLAIGKILIENFHILLAEYGLFELEFGRKLFKNYKAEYVASLDLAIQVPFRQNPLAMLHFIKYSYRKSFYNWRDNLQIYRNPYYYKNDQETWGNKERQLRNYPFQCLPIGYNDPEYIDIHRTS